MTEILLGVEKVGFEGRGRGEEGRGEEGTMETYMTHIGLYIALLFNYCTDVIHFGGQNIST